LDLEIFTDGACPGNPGGWGTLLPFGNPEKELWGFEPGTTNNPVGWLAAIRGIEALNRVTSVVLTTDSQYVRKGITEWVSSWKARGWKTAAKQPVKNKDLWEELEQLQQAHDLEWKCVKRHSGHIENERVDALANLSIDEMESIKWN